MIIRHGVGCLLRYYRLSSAIGCEYGGRPNRAECSLKGIYVPPMPSTTIGGITAPTTQRYDADLLPPFSPFVPLKGVQGVGGSENPTLVVRTSGAERQGGFCRPAGWPFVPLKGCRGLDGRRIRRCSLEPQERSDKAASADRPDGRLSP